VVRSASRVSTPAEGVLSQEIKFTPTQTAENRDPEEKPHSGADLRHPARYVGLQRGKGLQDYL